MQKAGAVVNEEKLDWINRAHIQRLPVKEFAAKLTPFIEQAGRQLPTEQILRIAAIEQERVSKLSDIKDNLFVYTDQPVYEKELLPWKEQTHEDVKARLMDMRNILRDISEEDFLKIVPLQEALGLYAVEYAKGNVFWPLRVALSGREKSPGPFEIMYVIGKEETLKRLDRALQIITQ